MSIEAKILPFAFGHLELIPAVELIRVPDPESDTKNFEIITLKSTEI